MSMARRAAAGHGGRARRAGGWRAPATAGLLLGLAGLAGLAGALSQLGCEPYGAVAAADADTVAVALPSFYGGAEADLFLYRITSRKTGERLGVARTFRVEQDRQVRSVLQLHDLRPGTELLVHVLWLNPDGKEVYTKEVHVKPDDWHDEALRAELARGFVTLDPDHGLFELESRYGVGPDRFDEELHKPEEKREFKLGRWTVRAYLFRKLILETSFDLQPME
jgi:hypothetical protein